MRTHYFFLLLLGFSLTSLAQIKNFHQISDQIYRSASPGRNTGYLVKTGFTHVLIFKNETKSEVQSEISSLIKLGIASQNIHHIPFEWKDMDSQQKGCEQVLKALNLLVSIEKSKTQKILFHCSLGEDRTGMLAGLYRMLYNNWTVDQAFRNEMCAYGYEAGDPGKPAMVVNQIRAEVTPLFLKIAALIQQKRISFDNINPAVCSPSGGLDSPVSAQWLADKYRFICK